MVDRQGVPIDADDFMPSLAVKIIQDSGDCLFFVRMSVVTLPDGGKISRL
jgi:hypothetical protein